MPPHPVHILRYRYLYSMSVCGQETPAPGGVPTLSVTCGGLGCPFTPSSDRNQRMWSNPITELPQNNDGRFRKLAHASNGQPGSFTLRHGSRQQLSPAGAGRSHGTDHVSRAAADDIRAQAHASGAGGARRDVRSASRGNDRCQGVRFPVEDLGLNKVQDHDYSSVTTVVVFGGCFASYHFSLGVFWWGPGFGVGCRG